MEKESDIDDILSYRSVAELKLQVFAILTYGNYSAECYQLIYLDGSMLKHLCTWDLVCVHMRDLAS